MFLSTEEIMLMKMAYIKACQFPKLEMGFIFLISLFVTGSLFPRRETAGSQPQAQVGSLPSNPSSSDQQDATLPDSNSRNREPQMRAVPIRTLVAAVPASVRRDSDSSRGSIGILYPVLARVQNVSLGNSIGARGSQTPDQHQHDPNGNFEQNISDAATQQQNRNGKSASNYTCFLCLIMCKICEI